MCRKMHFRKKRPHNGSKGGFWFVLLAFVLSSLLFSYISAQLTPLIETVASSKAINLISLAISEEMDASLASEQIDYQQFVTMEKDSDGRVTSLSFMAANGAVFKRTYIERLINKLEKIDSDELEIPIGTMSGVLLFSALGPSIRVRIQSVGDVTAEFENHFTSAGVNQTKHSIYLSVSATIYLLMPGQVVPVSVTERVCVAETVIVGVVPDTYLKFGNGAD